MKNPAYPSLLIYIPSYNRFDRLLEQIRRIEPYIDGKRCALHIRDNSSPDTRYLELSTLVDPAKTRVVRNQTNIGANANIMLGFLEGGGYDFLWILSDDDILEQDALTRVLQNLSHDIDLLYMQFHYIETESVDRLDMAGLLAILNYGLGRISNVVYRSEMVLPSVITGYDYIGSGFPHLSTLLAAVARRGEIVVKSVPASQVFADIPPAPPDPGEAWGYIVSLYGFPRLADFIADPGLRRRFLQGWVSDQGDLAIRTRTERPILYRNFMGYLFGCSKVLWWRMLLKEKRFWSKMALKELFDRRPSTEIRRLIRHYLR